jgi:uncharacterized FAD-dependent dehydrogenase
VPAWLVANVTLDDPELPPEVDLGARPALRAELVERLGSGDVTRALLIRRSLDVRARTPTWRGNFRVDAEGVPPGRPGVRPWTERDEVRQSGTIAAPTRSWSTRPIIVGAGPAGLFAALRLAEVGAPAILLERGGPVEDRVPAVNRFWRGEPLDPECNILYGEGGAGTFSDGKIYTRRRDGELGWIFRILVEAGANPGILQEGWAHLGTDRVRKILPVLRERLRTAGVEVRFYAAVGEFLVEGGHCVGVRTTAGETIRGGPVIVACGHSARDTARALLRAGAAADARPIAIGARIEHPQALVDAARYPEGRGELPAASYRLAWTPPEGRATYTFCMCPGGLIVPAQSEAGQVVVNGMSFSTRMARWANAALIVQVVPGDYGDGGALAGYAFQEAIERRAFELGGGDYSAPAQRVDDFLEGRPTTDLPRTSFPMGVASVDLARLLPPFVVEGMRTAIRRFGKQIAGYAGPEGVLVAPETRTTSPVRFRRDPRTLESPTLPGLLPCGEGAGYAGGIISAALDGYRVAEAVRVAGGSA